MNRQSYDNIGYDLTFPNTITSNLMPYILKSVLCSTPFTVEYLANLQKIISLRNDCLRVHILFSMISVVHTWSWAQGTGFGCFLFRPGDGTSIWADSCERCGSGHSPSWSGSQSHHPVKQILPAIKNGQGYIGVLYN